MFAQPKIILSHLYGNGRRIPLFDHFTSFFRRHDRLNLLASQLSYSTLFPITSHERSHLLHLFDHSILSAN